MPKKKETKKPSKGKETPMMFGKKMMMSDKDVGKMMGGKKGKKK